MRATNFLCLLMLAIACVISGHEARAINRCEDSAGHVTFQIDTCPAGDAGSVVDVQQSSPASGLNAAATEAGAEILNVPGVGDVAFMTLRDWDTEIRLPEGEREEGGATVRMTSRPGGEPVRLLLTFMKNPSGVALSRDQHIAATRQATAQYVEGSVEQEIRLRKLNTPVGIAMLANFQDQRYQQRQPPTGEYRSVTAGLLNGEAMVVSITILCNDVDSRVHDDALTVLESLLIIPVHE